MNRWKICFHTIDDDIDQQEESFLEITYQLEVVK